MFYRLVHFFFRHFGQLSDSHLEVSNFLDVAQRQWMIAVRRFEKTLWSLIPGATYLFVLFTLEENSNQFSPRNVGHKSPTDATQLLRRLNEYLQCTMPKDLYCDCQLVMYNSVLIFSWEDDRYVLVALKVFPSASYLFTTVRYAAMLPSHKVKQ